MKKIVFWRKWLRSLHRDFGYFIVGLTFIYAISGLAVNHLEDWDPNFRQVDDVQTIDPQPYRQALLEGGTASLARVALSELGAVGPIDDIYQVDESHYDITLQNVLIYVDLERNELRREGQHPRILLRLANWLHLNRGKKAWTIIADGYAVLLLFIAFSGLFILKSKRRFFNRKNLLVAAGFSVPILYVWLSGGP
ncbi:MAG: PepSY-associated TM helix domain-containing protein [Polyangiaceae bacterium]|nr:PepSY-associated TM helix domain-containing protein [Polyangiaceae bacterium]